MNRNTIKQTKKPTTTLTTQNKPAKTTKSQRNKRQLTTLSKKTRPKSVYTNTTFSPIDVQQRSMAAQPAGRKAFQTTGVTQAVAPNPNTSKSQFRLELLKNYNRDGYVLVKQVLTPANIEVMDKDMKAIFRGKYPNVRGLAPSAETLTDEELNNFSGIEHPLKVAAAARNLVFNNPQIQLSLKALIGRNVKCVSSDYWIQGPGEYGRAWASDEEVIMTRDKSLVLALFALDDLGATAGGTVLMHPASHKSGILYPPSRSPYDQENASGSETSYDWQSFVKRQYAGAKLTPLDAGPGFDESDACETFPPTITNPASAFSAKDDMDSITSVPVDMPAGSVLFVNGYTLQRMMAMSDQLHRRTLRVHFTSAETPVSWNTSAVESHLFAHHLEGLSYEEQLDLRDFMMVSGNDPYEYKGTRNIFPVELIRRRGPMGLGM